MTDLDVVYTGDARTLIDQVPDDSVDLILCDPVYDRPEDYGWLTEIGERVLKPGGNLLAQTAHVHLPAVLEAMTAGPLEYTWIMAEVFPYAGARMWYRRVIAGWKPYLWFTKPPMRMGMDMMDRFKGGGRAKGNHAWGDSLRFFFEVIPRLVEEGGVVLDPFAGGGSVPAACKMLNRRYIAFELDPEQAEIARKAVKSANPPLPIEVETPEIQLLIFDEDKNE